MVNRRRSVAAQHNDELLLDAAAAEIVVAGVDRVVIAHSDVPLAANLERFVAGRA